SAIDLPCFDVLKLPTLPEPSIDDPLPSSLQRDDRFDKAPSSWRYRDHVSHFRSPWNESPELPPSPLSQGSPRWRIVCSTELPRRRRIEFDGGGQNSAARRGGVGLRTKDIKILDMALSTRAPDLYSVAALTKL